MANNIFTADLRHGLAKRIISVHYFQAQFERALNTPRARDSRHDIVYIGAYSRTGIYWNNGVLFNMNDLELKKEPKCPFDISFGSPLVALEALLNYVAIQKVFGSKRVLFLFYREK